MRIFDEFDDDSVKSHGEEDYVSFYYGPDAYPHLRFESSENQSPWIMYGDEIHADETYIWDSWWEV